MLKNFFKKTSFISYLVVLVTIFGNLHAETYLQYVNRINSIKHKVKQGDSLSEILEKKGYKDIYRYHGALNQTYWKNGIRPKGKLKKDMVLSLPYNKSIVEKHTKSYIEPHAPGIEEWNISALYGIKYVSIFQSGDLNKADFGVLFVNNFKLVSEFIFDHWSTWFQFDAYKFKFKSKGSADEDNLYSLDLGLSYDWILVGLQIDQLPIFRNSSGTVEMERVSLLSLSVGGKRNLELSRRIPAKLNLKGWFNYPIFSSSGNSDIDIISIRGVGVHGQAELDYNILKKPLYSLHATSMVDLGYQKVSQDLEWEDVKGSVNSSIFNLSTALGLLLKF